MPWLEGPVSRPSPVCLKGAGGGAGSAGEVAVLPFLLISLQAPDLWHCPSGGSLNDRIHATLCPCTIKGEKFVLSRTSRSTTFLGPCASWHNLDLAPV